MNGGTGEAFLLARGEDTIEEEITVTKEAVNLARKRAREISDGTFKGEVQQFRLKDFNR